MEKSYNAIHVGNSGFPIGEASINKCIAVYKTLINQNIDVIFLNVTAIHPSSHPLKIDKAGTYDGIHYYYTTPSPYRPESFFKRRYYNFIGRINEFFFILNLAINKKIDVMIYYPNGSFFNLPYYRIFSNLFSFPIVSHYVEYQSAFRYGQSKWTQLNYVLFDKYFMRFVDGILPISEFLINHIKGRGFKGQYLKIPPLVNFDAFESLIKDQNENYFLFAGSLAYEESISLILDSFSLVEDESFSLYLVLNGSLNKMNNFEARINHHKKRKSIKLFSNLDYQYYLQLLHGATSLLVPLSDSIQDIARFPQKISEYTATRNPIITTNNGEIQYYFKDGYNALVADINTAIDFSNKMNYVCKYPDIATKIGLEGYRTGLKYFDSNSYNSILKEFILEIIKRNSKNKTYL